MLLVTPLLKFGMNILAQTSKDRMTSKRVVILRVMLVTKKPTLMSTPGKTGKAPFGQLLIKTLTAPGVQHKRVAMVIHVSIVVSGMIQHKQTPLLKYIQVQAEV